MRLLPALLLLLAGCVTAGPARTDPEKAVTILYGAGSPDGAKLELEGVQYELKPAQSVIVPIPSASAVASVWECPKDGCRWAPFTVEAGKTYQILDRGPDGRLAVVEYHAH